MMQTLTRITLGKDGRKGALGVTAVLLMGLFLPGRPVLGQADAPAPDKPQEKAAAAPQEAPRDPNAEPDIDPAEDDQSVAGAPSDSLDELLRSLESNPLNLSGAELDMEVIGDQLILRGNQNDLDIVELLVRMLESTGEKKVLRVVTVTEKDAKEIASTIEAPLQAVFFEPNRRPELELSITALSSNIVLVSALPDQLDFIVGVIHQVDETKEDLPDLEQLVFPIKHRKAAAVADQLKDIIKKMTEKQGRTGARAEIQIIPNSADNSIMVLAPETQRDKIRRLIETIDVEPVKGWSELKLTLFPLLHSKAAEMATVITDLLQTQQDREAAEEVIHRLQISKALPDGEIVELPPIDLQKPTRIIADDGTNSLIVATVEENVGPLGELIRLMDVVPMAEALTMKLFPLRFADAQALRDLLQDMMDKGPPLTEDPDGSGAQAVPADDTGKALVYKVQLFADVRTQTLIVTGRAEHLALIEQMIGELDRPASALKFPLRFITLDRTEASRVGEIVTELFDQRFQAAEATEAGRAALERERVFLSTDERSNSLIVSASPENFAEIVLIARQLDTKPARLFEQFRIIRCQRLSASDVREKIDDLWQRKVELRREEDLKRDVPIIVVDERSNSLIVASNIDDYEEIKRLIERLEAQPLIEGTKLFKLDYADAEVLSGMLDQLFEGIAGESETFQAPTILPDPRSNALVTAGSRDALERVSELVGRLDVEAGPLTAVFRVYPLRFASAGQLSQRMQELFDSRDEGTDVSRTPVVLLADEASNSLVTSASRDDHTVITELLELLDRPSTLARYFEIFPLKMARAANVAEKLESLFQSQGDTSGGRADAIASQADERTNSIIVWASPAQMSNIKEVISRLDTSTPTVELMVKVIQLKQALAEDFATLLQDALLGEGGEDEPAMILSFIKKNANGSETVRKLLRQDIRVEADTRTNSLMVIAPPDSIAMLESMIREFDAIRPIRSELRLFPLINSDAENMADQLTQLFEAEGGGDGEAPNPLVFGGRGGDMEIASVGQKLRFAADARTNTLIAAGAEVDLGMVEDLIQILDAQTAETRVTEVYKAKFLQATDIASAVQGFNQQEQDVLGELDDEAAQTRRMARQISVESVGSEEDGSSSLIIGTDRRMYQRTMEMIQQLDRPEPQVRISVVVAEVTLTDNFEFGIELAGQELDFTRRAVTGSNGLILGPDFDFVGGTNLSAAGSGLGFNFTITGEDFSFLLHALQQNSRLEILSRPSLTITNGEEGNITIADQIPFVESSQINDTGSTNSVIGSEDVGIVLTATPQISPDGYVTIALQQEISNFAGENLQLTEGVSSPILSTREVITNVTVRDGETVVIGGLITSRISQGETKVPILGDLPFIGPLFRTTSESETKTELLIAMTVDVLRTTEDVRAMSIAERDRFVLPDSIRQSPLLEGLRIRPDKNLMGPHTGRPPATGDDGPEKVPSKKRELYGPRPRTYGPVVPRATSTTTQAAIYGPKIARSED